jgi:hypothetical protein
LDKDGDDSRVTVSGLDDFGGGGVCTVCLVC